MSSYFGTTCELCICGSVKRIIVENFVVLSVIHEEEKMVKRPDLPKKSALPRLDNQNMKLDRKVARILTHFFR